jgi:hypothetical protein
MILVCGDEGDRVTRFFCKRLDALRAKYKLLNLSCYPRAHQLTQYRGDSCSGSISWPGGFVQTSDLTGVFVRDLNRWDLHPETQSDPDVSLALHAEKALGLEGFWAELDCVVVNRFASNWSNQSKPYQTLIVRGGLFEIPKTLITNDSGVARRFHEQMRRQVIYKSASGRSLGTKLVDQEILTNLLSTRDAPIQVQERVPGVDVRVHVVRDQIFATRIRSEVIDYRLDNGEQTQLDPWDLPATVASECIRTTKQFGLLFCGIDLRETPDGKYYFLEANPAPDFAFYEERTGQEISIALCDVLSAG